MDWWQAIILGAVQGLTEFLPVSSSGHLVIFQKLFGLPEHDLSFDVVAHLGTLFAILWVFRSSVLSIFKDLMFDPFANKGTNGARIFWFSFWASFPAAILGLSFKNQFEALFNNIFAVGCFLIFTAALLKLSQVIEKKYHNSDNQENLLDVSSGLQGVSQLNWKKAVLIGFSQACAIAPGVSRSGSTIATALILKVPRNTASLFSFALATPAIIGATILQLSKVDTAQLDYLNLSLGFVGAFFFGLVGLLGLLNLVRRGRIDIFSFYLVLVGTGCLAYSWL